MARVQILPKEDASNGWSRILPPRQPAAALEGDVRADWLVVGAGFAGLAAARRLAENRPDDHVVLLEAHEVGEGASGRNSGFAIDLPHNVGGEFQELSNAQGYIRLSRAAIDHLDGCVARHGIDCAYTRRGKYHAAVSERGRRKVLVPFARTLEALGEPHRWLDAAELRKEVGTPYHSSALHTPGGRLFNPAGLTRGLAATLPENVTLHEHTPVTGIEQRNGIRAVTPAGTVDAKTMVLAVNGYAPQFGVFKGALLTFAAHGSLTRPLTEDEHRALGGVEDWGLTPANSHVGVTLRYTTDRRILVRQRFSYAPRLRRPDAEYATLRRDHRRLFPRALPDAAGGRDRAHLARLRVPLAQPRAGLRQGGAPHLRRGLPECDRRHQGHDRRRPRRGHGQRPGQPAYRRHGGPGKAGPAAARPLLRPGRARPPPSRRDQVAARALERARPGRTRARPRTRRGAPVRSRHERNL